MFIFSGTKYTYTFQSLLGKFWRTEKCIALSMRKTGKTTIGKTTGKKKRSGR